MGSICGFHAAHEIHRVAVGSKLNKASNGSLNVIMARTPLVTKSMRKALGRV